MTTADAIYAFRAALTTAGLYPVNQSAEFGEVWKGHGATAVIDYAAAEAYVFSGGWDDHDAATHHAAHTPASVSAAVSAAVGGNQ